MNRCIKLLLILFSPLLLKAQPNQFSKSLDEGWKFSKVTEQNWLPATVPGTVHTDLLNTKRIPDPFFRTNERDLQWIDKEDWAYKTTFELDDKVLSHEHIELEFLGLDTYADVFLNNTKILVADNMFRRWSVDVKKVVKTGANELRVHFKSPIKKILPVLDSLPYLVPVSDNDQSETRVSVFTRKAGYHYGWDWGPRFVTSGIWRPVHLKAWNAAKITDLFIKQKRLDSRVAELEAQLEVNISNEGSKTLEVFVENGKKPIVSRKVLLTKGFNRVNVSFSIDNPERWWPAGLGKQRQYNFKAVLKDGEHAISAREVKRGLRTVEVIQESDDKGRSFYFKVNEVPVFMKGANYIPLDVFLPRVTRERYESLINTALTSNMNMLRVWGGGIYEDDLFYDLCDEKGILVWQDFMFACALYPPFEDMRQNIYEEAVDNIKRLRNHSSIAMWAGNNEISAFVAGNFWGFKTKWAPRDSTSIFNMYREIFHHILPAALSTYDSEKFYWSSSPNGENMSLEYSQGQNKGDMHYWGVWGRNHKIEAYNTMIPRFMSEYGFQSFPEMATINKFAKSADFNMNSEVMTFHQRSNKGNKGITDHMKDWFKSPSDFNNFLYVGQLLQAEAIKIGIEAHRRAMPYCMGSLYWQINDVWPAASWSSVDYYGRWKAQQYYVKNAYKEIISSTILDKDSLKIYIISDRLKSASASLEITLKDFQGKILKQEKRPVTIGPNTSKLILAMPVGSFIQGLDRKQILLQAKIIENGNELSNHNFYFEKPKDLILNKPAVQFTLSRSGDLYRVNLKSRDLARYVRLSVGQENVIFSDNFFDLIPGEDRQITFRSAKVLDKKDISITTLFDSFHQLHAIKTAQIKNEETPEFTSLVTPNPMVQATKVYQFLRANYGKKIISGVMTLNSFDETNWLKQNTGKAPVIMGLDFMHCNRGYTWYNNDEPVNNAKTWWDKNGIPTMMWHWRDPSRKTEAFSTSKTTFDVSKIADPESVEYKAMLSDIDDVSGQLKKLQQRGVPVIWRPLHEAAGGWFWWGAKGAAPCKKLWQLMFDRMVNHHGLKNLIWVWTREPNDEAWFPGDQYVDMVGRDLYPQKGDHSSHSIDFNNINAVYGGRKMIALTECGGIPDPDNLINDAASWSWFMPWYGSFVKDEATNPIALWKKIMNHSYVITLDEMPSLK